MGFRGKVVSHGMRALVIGHDHVAGSGYVGDRLIAHGYELEQLTVVPNDRYETPWVEFDFPQPGAHDLVVALGAPWPREKIESWAAPEREFLRDCHKAGIPVLGISFGAQQLAVALGGRTERASSPQIGWLEVTTTAPDLVPHGPWFHWHADRMVVPEEAVELASGVTGTEAFAVGRSLGVQFHPEITTQLVGRWLSLIDTLDDVGSDRAAELITEAIEWSQVSRDGAYKLVDAFLRRAGEPTD